MNFLDIRRKHAILLMKNIKIVPVNFVIYFRQILMGLLYK